MFTAAHTPTNTRTHACKAPSMHIMPIAFCTTTTMTVCEEFYDIFYLRFYFPNVVKNAFSGGIWSINSHAEPNGAKFLLNFLKWCLTLSKASTGEKKNTVVRI